MAQNLKLSVLLRLNDQVSGGLRSALNRVSRESIGASRSLADIANAANRVRPTGVVRMNAAMRAANNEGRGPAASVGGLASVANRIRPLGVERMTAALRAMQTSARASLASLGQISRLSMRGGIAMGAGAVAGGYIAKSAAERPLSYDRNLALLSNTANNELDVTGRIVAKEKMNMGIRNAVTIGGGSPLSRQLIH